MLFRSVSLRSIIESSLFTVNSAITLIIVSIIRSGIIWVILNGLAYLRDYLSRFGQDNTVNN